MSIESTSSISLDHLCIRSRNCTILSMSWSYLGTASPQGHASALQSLPDNPPAVPGGSLPQYTIYGARTTAQRTSWDFGSISERSADEVELSSMPKTRNFIEEVSSSAKSNSPRYVSSPDLDTSVRHSVRHNGKGSRGTGNSNLEKDVGPYSAPSMEEGTQISPRHYCHSEGCRHTKGFARLNDLRRHQKKHDSDTPLWYCGCCKNMGDEGYKGTPRKDHLKQHLIIKHQMGAPQDCPENPCSGRGRILFSSEACVEEHLSQEHGYQITEEVTSSACNCSKKRKKGDMSLQMLLAYVANFRLRSLYCCKRLRGCLSSYGAPHDT